MNMFQQAKPYFIVLTICAFLISCTNTTDNKLNKAPLKNTITLSAVDDFKKIDGKDTSPYAPAYIDKNTNSLAINAVHYKNVFSNAQTIFNGVSGVYQIELTALTELDGESQYQISVNTQAYPLKTNPRTSIDYAPYTHKWESIRINSGDKLGVSFSSTTNGLIPEGDITAFSRGRWTEVKLTCVKDCS